MPVYTYRCKDCEKEFDLLVGVGKSDEEEELKCPKCGSKNTERLLTAFGTGGISSASSCTAPT